MWTNRFDIMKKLLCVLLFFFTAGLHAQTEGLGLGLIAGAPSGFSAKYWVNPENAFDAGIGYSFVGGESLSLHADYLYHIEDVFNFKARVPFYYGFGFRYRSIKDSDNSFGARGAVGVLLYLKDYPADFFLEIAPVFTILPETALKIDVGIGARYYFPANKENAAYSAIYNLCFSLGFLESILFFIEILIALI